MFRCRLVLSSYFSLIFDFPLQYQHEWTAVPRLWEHLVRQTALRWGWEVLLWGSQWTLHTGRTSIVIWKLECFCYAAQEKVGLLLLSFFLNFLSSPVWHLQSSLFPVSHWPVRSSNSYIIVIHSPQQTGAAVCVCVCVCMRVKPLDLEVAHPNERGSGDLAAVSAPQADQGRW